MDISAAAMPPVHPTCSVAEQNHPRFNEYARYRTSMTILLVESITFALWLKQTEEAENSHEVVFKAGEGASEPFVPNMWYKHKFGPNHVLEARIGPFNTKDEAIAEREETSLHHMTKYIGQRTKKRDGFVIKKMIRGEAYRTWWVKLVLDQNGVDWNIEGTVKTMPDFKPVIDPEEYEEATAAAWRGLRDGR